MKAVDFIGKLKKKLVTLVISPTLEDVYSHIININVVAFVVAKLFIYVVGQSSCSDKPPNETRRYLNIIMDYGWSSRF